MLKLKKSHFILPLIVTFTVLPAIAQSANFKPLQLARGFDRADASVTGNTGGTYDFAKNLAEEDYRGQRCMGFGSQTPDHIMNLEEELPELTLLINSGGNDTTLIIKGPDGKVRCGDDSPSGKDAQISDRNWDSGKYQVWVGSLTSGQNWQYRLSAKE